MPIHQTTDRSVAHGIAFALAAALCVAGVGVARADDPNVGKPLVLNALGSFTDVAMWIFRTADGKYTIGTPVKGTNELLVMPSPEPSPGDSVSGVTLSRHKFDTLGYPLHISLLEKLFAAAYQVPIYVGSGGQVWIHQNGDPIADEKPMGSGSRPALKYWGPFHADAIPFDKSPEPEIQAAFTFAKGAMKSLGNMPDAQKNLANYGILFVDDGDIVWVEFGPRFGPNEAPHLGCQTQLGRDMVFGYNKKQTDSTRTIGKFVQCF